MSDLEPRRRTRGVYFGGGMGSQYILEVGMTPSGQDYFHVQYSDDAGGGALHLSRLTLELIRQQIDEALAWPSRDLPPMTREETHPQWSWGVIADVGNGQTSDQVRDEGRKPTDV